MMPGMPEPSDLVSASGVAAHYGVAADTVTAWARAGLIPTAVRTAGGHRRYRLVDVFAARPPSQAHAELDAAADRGVS